MVLGHLLFVALGCAPSTLADRRQPLSTTVNLRQPPSTSVNLMLSSPRASGRGRRLRCKPAADGAAPASYPGTPGSPDATAAYISSSSRPVDSGMPNEAKVGTTCSSGTRTGVTSEPLSNDRAVGDLPEAWSGAALPSPGRGGRPAAARPAVAPLRGRDPRCRSSPSSGRAG